MLAPPEQSQRRAIYHEIRQLAGVQLVTRIRESLAQLSRRRRRRRPPPPPPQRHQLHGWLMNASRAEQIAIR